ncbi:beta-ketoacyl-[acyl-carrier-protein] synthase family protein [Chryseobacterium sp. SNU WT5]|uniref:beta-ketoacyl-[acyl-carrier-protein] synthase family protein n=1 Tax=Chryseobacterium sp. SNU WT5 TaxID=2594269 RepID=UPI00117DA7D8|nr:beta-ketoacyl-[acyl-carrier-protein] synthase family protein [Chryseobacterium sp. SNU WT5]QDP85572.1 beta-ketoacyl-[acyl-carrier-protein] synthase family protein [Chryseobacterium sp. SNU WT5]
MKNRVVVTGFGSISSLGNNVDETEQNLKNGRINYQTIPIERFPTDSKTLQNNQGFIMDQNLFNSSLDKDISLMVELAKLSINEALEMANISPDDIAKRKSGLCLGTSVGASYAIIKRMKKSLEENVDDYKLALYSSPKVIGNIAKEYKLKGPVSAISTACASGTNSIGRAFDLIENGKTDVMICGGMDIFTELTYTGFNSLMAISKTKCNPFSNKKNGMSLGDASTVLILENLESAIARDAKIYAEIKGYCILNEAYHPTAPHPDGIYALKCMQKTLDYGGVAIEELDYINAHGTGTVKNDSSELIACETLLQNKKNKTFVGSTKSLTGHALGAAGSLEALISILSIKNSELYGKYDDVVMPDAPKIDFVTENVYHTSINNVISNSFGFGGNMSSILISKYNN